MDKNRKIAIIYYLAAAVCYICAVIWFCGSNTSLGTVWLCIGSANLCLGSVWMKRSSDAENQENEKNSEEDKK